MKNLVVHTHIIHNLDEEESKIRELLKNDVIGCTNPDNDDLYVLRETELFKISARDVFSIASTKVELEGNVKPVGVEYSSDLHQLWCAYENGAVVSMNVEPKLCQDVINYFPEGLKCIKLSPDQEILVLITNDDTVITTISNFHVVSKVELNSSDYGENQFITVGWGKKETQFHGSAGKAAAKAKDIIIPRTENDDGKPRISWRGDGSMFAVSFLRKDGEARLFKVFNREGVLQCTSELTTGMECHLSWKPSGNLIAASQLLPNKHVVAFFEKNGLKHRELCLPYKPNEIEIIKIMWSYDSDILSILLKNKDSGETCLQLWTENNYHWYCKQTLKFSVKNPLVYCTWSAAPRAGKRLILLTRENMMIYSFRWTVHHSRGFDNSDKAIVGVINGKEALMTGFRVGIVPPPMAHVTLKFDENINSIIFAPSFTRGDSFDSNTFMCLLGDNRLALCSYLKDSRPLEYNHHRTYEIEWNSAMMNDVQTYSLHHFLWFNENTILCSASSSTSSFLCHLDLEGEDFKQDGRIVVRDLHLVDDHIEHVIPSPDKNVAYIVAGSSVFRYTTGEGIVPTPFEIPETCSLVEIMEIESRHVILSLTSRGRFFVDGNETASNITSFFIHSEFLLLTTLQHTLICLRLDDDGFRQINQDLTIKPWENGCNEKNSSGLSIRRVERGSNIILAIPKDPRVILQMPRGNLECVQPRALSLHIIGIHLDNLNYAVAFDMMRKQRINLNLIFDHDPSSFMENAHKFVDAIRNPSWLSLFLSELQDENVTETIYKSSYQDRRMFQNPANPYLREEKVQMVCDLLRGIMELREDSSNLIQPILTSLVKNRQVPGLEAALRKIKEVRANEENESSDTKKSLSESALRYLLYLVDVNVLFDIAMGMYDFELALFVASKSQKDPKEYIPLLEDLKKREENYMKYSIDKDLKRFDSALVHIAKSPNKFDECLEFVCKHNMYAKALKLFPRNSEEYRKIAKVYADVLMKKEKYCEAAVMYTRSWFLFNALHAHKAAGNWQDVIIVATQLNFEPRDMKELYEELVSQLTQQKRYRDAAEILMNHLKQQEDAVSILCEGQLWRDAMRIVHTMKKLDFIETHIKPGVQEHVAYLLYTTNHNRETFEKHKIRLATVRQDNATRDLRLQEALGADFDYTAGREVSDLLSETSSVAGSLASQSSRSSRSSGRSYRSSKNRRKQERKLLSTKEGSFFEDLALIRALHQLITVTYAHKEEVKLVTQMLLIFEHDEMAENLQTSFGEFLNVIQRSISEIWPPKPSNDCFDMRDESISLKDGQHPNIPQSLIEPHFLYPPNVKNVDWQLEIFNAGKNISG